MSLGTFRKQTCFNVAKCPCTKEEFHGAQLANRKRDCSNAIIVLITVHVTFVKGFLISPSLTYFHFTNVVLMIWWNLYLEKLLTPPTNGVNSDKQLIQNYFLSWYILLFQLNACLQDNPCEYMSTVFNSQQYDHEQIGVG